MSTVLSLTIAQPLFPTPKQFHVALKMAACCGEKEFSSHRVDVYGRLHG
jgi:hypothetical protein